MATLLGEKNKTLKSTLTIEDVITNTTRKEWSVIYLVLAGSGEYEEDVFAASGLPQLHQVYRNGYCTQKEAKEVTVVAGGSLWEVECEFSSHVEVDIPVVEISWEIEEKEEVVVYDAITGVPILNSAYERIIATSPLPIPVLNMTRIEAFFNPSLIFQYNNHINFYPFLGAPPKCALMVGPTARKRIIDGVARWEVNYRIKFNLKINPQTIYPQGWTMYLLDHGTRFIKSRDADTSTINFESFKNDEDKDDTTGNLDGYGNKLPDNVPEVYLAYNRYPLANFNSLNLT